MDPDRERAALVALLRHGNAGWSETALEIQEAGSASGVLARRHGGADTLFPEDGAIETLIEAAARDIAGWAAEGIRTHAFFDASYPQQLRGIREMPPVLFTRGDLRADRRAVALVGTRDATPEGRRTATAVATALCERGVTVVSGLAAGIDTAAHEAALAAGGRTVAVIGTGLRRAYPAANRALQLLIAERGLVVSQFWPDAAPTKQSFPMRNAVMSGYAAATVVVEAGWRSGARIQARLALQHGRPVILTDQLMRNDWAREFAQRPGVRVVGGLADLLAEVDGILARAPTDDLEGFPDLASL